MSRLSCVILAFLSIHLFKSTSSNILIPCKNDTECDVIASTSTCSNFIPGYCQCPAGFTFSSDATKCLKEVLYGESCIEGNQCSHMLGAQCNNGICLCPDEKTYTRGKCRHLVNLKSACDDEIDCFFGYNRESVECINGKCECASGFYERSTNVCRRESIAGDFCVVNSDCVDDFLCSNFVCTKTSSVSTQTSSKRDASVQTSFEESFSETKINKSHSQTNRRIRDIDYNKLDNSEATKFSFDDDSTQFGDSCESEHNKCPGLKYSICRRGFCQCQEGYYEKDKLCKAELGEKVDEERFCGSGRFERGKCVCQNNQFYSQNQRTCLKASLGISNSCTQEAQCSPYGAAYCSSEAPRQCKCHLYAKYNEKTELCELKKGLGEYCETSETCKIENTECNTNDKTCSCRENFIAQNGNCKPGMDAVCEKNEDCAFENAECKVEEIDETKSVKKCICKDEYINVGNSCFEKAKNYNDTCMENDQCKPLLGEKASCIENKCSCNSNLHFNQGKCREKRELDVQCTNNAECYVSDPESVECRNGVCHCKFNYTKSNNHCRPREKNSSNNVSPLKVITLLLIGSATMIVSAALKDAYFP